jgi:hypothetical protein
MEIGPILGIPPVTMVKPDRLAPDLSRVFEAEYLGGSSDDAYTPEDSGADSEASEGAPEANAEIAGVPRPEDEGQSRKIDCFA